MDAIWSEMKSFNISSNQVVQTRGNTTFGSMPLGVLSAGSSINATGTGSLWYKYQQDLASLSTNSTWNIVWECDHNIALCNPQKVIQFVEMVSNSTFIENYWKNKNYLQS